MLPAITNFKIQLHELLEMHLYSRYANIDKGSIGNKSATNTQLWNSDTSWEPCFDSPSSNVNLKMKIKRTSAAACKQQKVKPTRHITLDKKKNRGEKMGMLNNWSKHVSFCMGRVDLTQNTPIVINK